MEYNKENLTPLDRLDERYINKLLAGCAGDDIFDDNNCGVGVPNSDFNTSCGCLVTRRRDNSCGRMNQARRDSSCASANKSRRGNDCGCGNDSRKDISCGCASKAGVARMSDNTACGCGKCENYEVPHLHGNPLSMLYSPHQEWEGLYEIEDGFARGTIFKCLDFPFYPVRCHGGEIHGKCGRCEK